MTNQLAYEERVKELLHAWGLSVSLLGESGRVLYPECNDLTSVGRDMFGREQWLEPRTASRWELMRAAAAADGVQVLLISGFRSFEHQQRIIERKLAAGAPLDQILSVNALPGFSEHHTGRAVDIGTPGCAPLSEEFERTSAFDWLLDRAREFGFHMSYPRDNRFGIIYEPWHWASSAMAL